MMVEIGAAQVLGFLLTVLSTVGGIWIRRLNDKLDQASARTNALKSELLRMQTQLAKEANAYSRRSEIAECIARIEAKIDRLADKLAAKQDRVS